eukprot:s3503_g2.t1
MCVWSSGKLMAPLVLLRKQQHSSAQLLLRLPVFISLSRYRPRQSVLDMSLSIQLCLVMVGRGVSDIDALEQSMLSSTSRGS